MTVLLERRSAYGVSRIYPACPISELLTQLTGRKTLLNADLEIIQRLGYTVTWTWQTAVHRA